MPGKIQNQLAAVRHRRGISTAELARRAGVSRATIYAIDAGNYVANTEVTLNLAQELEVPAEDLFSLTGDARRADTLVPTELLGAEVAEQQPVRLGRVGDKWVSAPVADVPCFLPDCDGLVSASGRAKGKADVLTFQNDETFRSAAEAFGVDFVPLLAERYDFVLRKETLNLPAAKGFVEVLQKTALRRMLEGVAGCDMGLTGSARMSAHPAP